MPEADRGQDRPERAGEGQVTGRSMNTARLPLLAGTAGAGGVEEYTAGHPGAGGPGRDLLPDQVQGP